MNNITQVHDIDALLNSLDALEPSRQHNRNAHFSKLYPGIVRALARNVPQKAILTELESLGLKLHPVRFKAMLAAEAKALDERGENLHCEHCGAALSASASCATADQDVTNSAGKSAEQGAI